MSMRIRPSSFSSETATSFDEGGATTDLLLEDTAPPRICRALVPKDAGIGLRNPLLSDRPEFQKAGDC